MYFAGDFNGTRALQQATRFASIANCEEVLQESSVVYSKFPLSLQRVTLVTTQRPRNCSRGRDCNGVDVHRDKSSTTRYASAT